MELTEKMVLDAVVKLGTAGKKVPEPSMLLPNESIDQARRRNLQDVTKLIYSTFKARKVTGERWLRATEKALTMNGNYGVNLNLITPALFSLALELDEKEERMRKRGRCLAERGAERLHEFARHPSRCEAKSRAAA